MNKTAANISKAVAGAGAVALVSLAAIFGVQQIRTAQAEQAAAVEQAEIQAAEQAQFEALVVKFSSPVKTEAVKPEPDPPVVVVETPPVAEEPVAEEPYYGVPVPWVVDPNERDGGHWDTTACPSGRAAPGPDGNQYCA